MTKIYIVYVQLTTTDDGPFFYNVRAFKNHETAVKFKEDNQAITKALCKKIAEDYDDLYDIEEDISWSEPGIDEINLM